MKNKLRSIKIDISEYLYTVTNKYHSGPKTNMLTIKIYLSGQKKTPLILDFLTLDDFHIGQPLNSGVILTNTKTNTTTTVNINEPKYIREFILKGLKNGWTGSNNLGVQNGLEYLTDLGFEVSNLKPKANEQNQ
ncbi:MAG TPA: hypothetical protein VNS58_29460 [Puia sp.]|nr:hypothetical protein [Puia sp.]